MSFGFKELLVIAVLVALIFGTKKLRNLGSDLGASVKGFKDAVQDGEEQVQSEGDSESKEQEKS